jgi:ATP-dependent Lhr-like helicase
VGDVFKGFSRPITAELKRLGLEVPTEIQNMAIPPILKGENTLLIAPTGMGKTEAALLPILELLLRLRGRDKSLRGISAIYITPLRSLNRDIFRRLVEIGEQLGIKIDIRHGDTPPKARKMQALSPPNILITTPETLQAILVGRKMRQHLQSARWVVVDEIHEMASDKRGVQLTLALERLTALTAREFQRIGLSATVGDPAAVGAFLVGKGRSVKILRSEFYRNLSVSVESPTPSKEDETYRRFGISIQIHPCLHQHP